MTLHDLDQTKINVYFGESNLYQSFSYLSSKTVSPLIKHYYFPKRLALYSQWIEIDIKWDFDLNQNYFGMPFQPKQSKKL